VEVAVAVSDVPVLVAVGDVVEVSVAVGSSVLAAVGVGSLGVFVGTGVRVASSGYASVASGSTTGVTRPKDCSPSAAAVIVGEGIAVTDAGWPPIATVVNWPDATTTVSLPPLTATLPSSTATAVSPFDSTSTEK
jgi:hypothetical protein